MARPPHTCSAEGACLGFLPGAALAAEPSAAFAPLACAGEGGIAQVSTTTSTSARILHHYTSPLPTSARWVLKPGTPRGQRGQLSSSRALTCSPVAILPSTGTSPTAPPLKYSQAGVPAAADGVGVLGLPLPGGQVDGLILSALGQGAER